METHMKLLKMGMTILVFLIVQNSYAIQLKKLKTYKGAGAPKAVEVSPNGKYALVMNLEGMDLWIIDTVTLKKKEIISFYPYRTAAKGHNYKTHKAIRSFA